MFGFNHVPQPFTVCDFVIQIAEFRMNVEYVSSKISAISWLNKDVLKHSNESNDQFWMCGTYDSSENSLSVWCNTDDNSENQSPSGICKLDGLEYSLNSDVISIVPYDKRSVIVSLHNGDLLWLNYFRDKGLHLVKRWSGNKDLVGHQSSGLLINSHNELVSCGLDGKLIFFDMKTRSITRSNTLTANSLHCLDKISSNEIICGTTSGHVKLFDKRSQKSELSLANEMAIITAVKRNSHIPHIVACANDIGLLYIWDLRNGGQRLMQPASAHMGSINCLQYAHNQPNLIFTSSFDGQLIKWNISNDCEIHSVEAIIDKNNTHPINCFDLNPHNQIVFADDNEVLYLTKF